MSPYTRVILNTVMRALRRECPRCGRKQLVPKARLRETVACEHCSAPIPPPAAEERR